MKNNRQIQIEETEWIQNFKQAYQKEMDQIQRPPMPAIPAATAQSISRRPAWKKRAMRIAAAAAAAVCIIMGTVNKNQIISFAEDFIQSFTLSSTDQKFELDALNPLYFDQEAFCADPKTKRIEESKKDGTACYSYYRLFSSYEKMHAMTGLTLPAADRVTYSKIMIHVNFEYGQGHLSVVMKYKDMKFGATGMFATDKYNLNSWGYGEPDNQIADIIDYADNKHAYFFDRTADEDVANASTLNDTIYFVQGDIMFQLFVPKSAEQKAKAVELLNILGGHEIMQE